MYRLALRPLLRSSRSKSRTNYLPPCVEASQRCLGTKKKGSKEKGPKLKMDPTTDTPPPPLQPPPSLVKPSSLIRTDLQEHLDWVESQRPSFDADNPPLYYADPSGVVSKDLTESMIDLKEMYDPRLHSSLDDNDDQYEPATPLCQELQAYMGVRGAPITVAEFMRQALTHPVHGYYTNPSKHDDDDDWDNDEDNWDDGTTTADEYIIGSKGDFVTAPEVSQVFGECLAVWFITQWQSMGKPSNIQLVEIGPGKGTLISDIVRSAMTSFVDFGNALQKIHLVEASTAMRAEQERKLQKLSTDKVKFVFESKNDSEKKGSAQEVDASPQDTGGNRRTIRVQWHDSFASVMKETESESLPTLVLCQEFIDALPVHVFEKSKDGWRERMVALQSQEDTDEAAGQQQVEDTSNDKKPRLRYVLAPDTTPALRTLLNVSDSGKMENDDSQEGAICEVCPQGVILVQDVAQFLSRHGGSALIVDYGQEGSTDSVRGFSKHKQVHPLSRPGEVDVTADVDFAALKHAVNVSAAEKSNHHAFGPVTQGAFLASMGAIERVSALIEDESTTDEQAEDLYNALERLIQPEHMGERYKVMSIAIKKDGIFSPPGF